MNDPVISGRVQQPCAGCPFRRTSKPLARLHGPIKAYSDRTRHGVLVPCYAHFNPSNLPTDRWDTPGQLALFETPGVPACYGQLITIRNSHTLPRDFKHRETMRSIPLSEFDKVAKDFFAWPHEFEQHHMKGQFAE